METKNSLNISSKFFSIHPKKLKKFREYILSAAHSTDKIKIHMKDTSESLFELHKVKKKKKIHLISNLQIKRKTQS